MPGPTDRTAPDVTSTPRGGRRPAAALVTAALVLVLGWSTGGAAAPAAEGGSSLPQLAVTANLTVAPNPVTVGTPVVLDARNSTGGESGIAACGFDVDGDRQIERETPDCLAEWTYEAAGTYEVVVHVRTQSDRNATDTATVTVREPQPPVPVIEVEPNASVVDEQIQFDGRSSHDPDGRIVRMVWQFPTRTFAGETVNTMFDEPGTYDVSLVVTDDAGFESATTRTITVRENRPPVVSLSVVGEAHRPGDTVSLDASDAHDPDGRIRAFRWDLDGDGEIDRITDVGRTTVAAATAGTRRVAVTVVDDHGDTATATAQLAIAPAATPTDGRTTATGARDTTPIGGDGSGLPLAPVGPTGVIVVIVGVALVGVGVAWRRRETVRRVAGRLRDRLGRGDVRRRVAKLASGTVTKTAAKRFLRMLADGIEAGGRGIGDTVERLGRAIKRWSGRVAAILRRLAG